MKKSFIKRIAMLMLALTCVYSAKADLGKKNDKYAKLFKNKKVESAKGKFISLHKMDNKLFLELPVKYFGRDMLIGSTLSGMSDPEFMSIGMKNADPLHIRFEKQDSLIVIKRPNTTVYRSDKTDANLDEALDLNYNDPTLIGFPVKAYKADSSAVVIDVTNFLARPNNLIEVFPKQMGPISISARPNSSLAFIQKLKVFDDNVSIKNEFNYTVDARLMRVVPIRSGVPTRVDVTYSILLLPKDPMTERISDSRVGVFSSSKLTFDQDRDKSEAVHLAHRWRIEPKDVEAFLNGELSEPTKKITFYLDDTFPAKWRAPIKAGVLRWNAAFQKIGFKNVVEVLDFPKNDPNFDPDNLNYSCIRYVPTNMENAMGPSWVDPRSGEIINASVIVWNNLESLVYKWRFVQTSNVDKRMRTDKLPDDYFAEGVSYAIAHEVGHTLGLMHNMSASANFPTDSLRSATFTQKYGTTPSIMDYARFNYVAQPQDKGVSLLPPYLGAYDYHAIEWNYRYFPKLAKQPKAQAEALEQMVDERMKNPLYRYGRQQWQVIDPSSITEDLGNDPIKSSNYGIKNLKSTLNHLGQWIHEDEDSAKKQTLNLAIVRQLHGYIKNVMHLIGGIYVQDSKESSNIPRYKVVPKAKQRQALLWAIQHIKDFKSYANRDLERRGFLSVSYYDQLVEFLIKDLFAVKARILLAQNTVQNTYTLEEYYNDMYRSIFAKTMQGGKLNNSERLLQRAFVEEGRIFVASDKRPPLQIPFLNGTLTDKYLNVVEQLGHCPNVWKAWIIQKFTIIVLC